MPAGTKNPIPTTEACICTPVCGRQEELTQQIAVSDFLV